MIDRHTVDRIMAAADIVDVVGDFVTLRRSGANFKGLCPFHDEKTPSFMVSPSKQICKCFSCNKGGNVITFLELHEQMTRLEALKWLGRKYGIEVRDRELTDEQKAAESTREAMFALNEWARNFFVDQLHHSSEGVGIGMSYFRQRGLRDDIIRKFQLGFSPSQRDSLAQRAVEKGFSSQYIESTGLCFKTDDGKLLDRYHGRVIFPVHTLSGRVVAFGGRILNSERKNVGKYVNSPESEIYSKKRELYGLYFAKQAISREDRCYLVEGYLDVISMHQSGVENVVASSGTSLTTEQVRLIHRLTNNVTVLYDGDAAGLKASLRGIDILLAEGLNIKVLLLPEGEDPDSLAQRSTPEEFRRFIGEGERDFIQFKTELLMQDAAHDPMKRADAIRSIVSSVAVVPSDIVRQVYIHELAGRLGIDEAVIVSEVASAIRSQQASERQRSGANSAVAVGNAPGSVGSGSTPPTPHAVATEQSPRALAEGGQQGVTTLSADAARGNTEELATTAQTAVGATADRAAVLNTLSATSPAQRRLAAAEREIVQLLVRHGERPIVLETVSEDIVRFLPPEFDENGMVVETRVAEEQPKLRPAEDTPYVAPYIWHELQMDEIKLSVPIYQQILDEAVARFEEGEFCARNYFTHHPNPEIAQMALTLSDEQYQLSRIQQQMYIPEEQRLIDLVPRAVNDLKYAVLSLEKERILHELRQPELLTQPQASATLMERLIEINNIELAFAKILGDRVLGK